MKLESKYNNDKLDSNESFVNWFFLTMELLNEIILKIKTLYTEDYKEGKKFTPENREMVRKWLDNKKFHFLNLQQEQKYREFEFELMNQNLNEKLLQDIQKRLIKSIKKFCQRIDDNWTDIFDYEEYEKEEGREIDSHFTEVMCIENKVLNFQHHSQTTILFREGFIMNGKTKDNSRDFEMSLFFRMKFKKPIKFGEHVYYYLPSYFYPIFSNYGFFKGLLSNNTEFCRFLPLNVCFDKIPDCTTLDRSKDWKNCKKDEIFSKTFNDFDFISMFNILFLKGIKKLKIKIYEQYFDGNDYFDDYPERFVYIRDDKKNQNREMEKSLYKNKFRDWAINHYFIKYLLIGTFMLESFDNKHLLDDFFSNFAGTIVSKKYFELIKSTENIYISKRVASFFKKDNLDFITLINPNPNYYKPLCKVNYGNYLYFIKGKFCDMLLDYSYNHGVYFVEVTGNYHYINCDIFSKMIIEPFLPVTAANFKTTSPSVFIKKTDVIGSELKGFYVARNLECAVDLITNSKFSIKPSESLFFSCEQLGINPFYLRSHWFNLRSRFGRFCSLQFKEDINSFQITNHSDIEINLQDRFLTFIPHFSFNDLEQSTDKILQLIANIFCEVPDQYEYKKNDYLSPKRKKIEDTQELKDMLSANAKKTKTI